MIIIADIRENVNNLTVAHPLIFRYTISKTANGREIIGKFAVIDIETNWTDQIMLIGTVIADGYPFEAIEGKCH